LVKPRWQQTKQQMKYHIEILCKRDIRGVDTTLFISHFLGLIELVIDIKCAALRTAPVYLSRKKSSFLIIACYDMTIIRAETPAKAGVVRRISP
jgi:hypothetical protein